MTDLIKVLHFYDNQTNTITYVVYHVESKDAVIIDPVLDFDYASVSVSLSSINRMLTEIKPLDLKVHYVLETHAHADHLSGACELKSFFSDAKTAIGKNIVIVQEVFKKIFNFDAEFPTDGRQFDRLLEDGETIQAGALQFKVLFTPGHTPACVSYVFDGFVFTGDALFMPDSGTGRCDFPGGDAKALFRSIHDRLYLLPEDTLVYVGHDYQPNARELMFRSTIGDEKQKNIQLKQSTSLEQFVAFRQKRDATLTAPKLLFPSIQVNISAGRLPPAENNGTSYLKLPVRRTV